MANKEDRPKGREDAEQPVNDPKRSYKGNEEPSTPLGEEDFKPSEHKNDPVVGEFVQEEQKKDEGPDTKEETRVTDTIVGMFRYPNEVPTVETALGDVTVEKGAVNVAQGLNRHVRLTGAVVDGKRIEAVSNVEYL